jgi:hypothetical protein
MKIAIDDPPAAAQVRCGVRSTERSGMTSRYRANQACSVWRDTPTFSATCDIDIPSPITANTA